MTLRLDTESLDAPLRAFFERHEYVPELSSDAPVSSDPDAERADDHRPTELGV